MMPNLIPLYMYLGHPMRRPERHYDYVIARQGIVKRVETPYASADVLLVPIAEELIGLNLATYPLQPLRLKVPRIPGRLLQNTLIDARANIDREVMYHFRYTSEAGWVVSRPEQRQDAAWVGYTEPDPAGIVLEMHSHNVMSAFFSPTDDADERGGRFYAVIGRLDRPEPQLVLRMGLYGHWLFNVPGLVLFEDLGPLVDTYIDRETTWPDPEPGWVSKLLPWR